MKTEFVTTTSAQKTCFSFLLIAAALLLFAFSSFVNVTFAQSGSINEPSFRGSNSGGVARLGGEFDEADRHDTDLLGLNSAGVWSEHLGDAGSGDTSGSNDFYSGPSPFPGSQEATSRPVDYIQDDGDDLEENGEPKESEDIQNILAAGPKNWFNSDNGWFGREGISASLKTLLVMSALAIAPAILLMTTSYIRVSVVLALLRQALGAGQIPSNQVIAALSIFLTVLIMAPVWTDVYTEAVEPYSLGEISNIEAFNKGQEPIRTFLWRQIERSGNTDTINIFTRYIPEAEAPEYYEDVPWRALGPAFVLSELKTALLIGFQIFLPFLIIDVIVSCVLVSAGMMMLPPAIVSLPFKLALFVLVDGWTLVVKSLLESFAWNIGV